MGSTLVRSFAIVDGELPIGAYILPPPDLDGTMGKEIDDLLKDE